MAKAQTQEKAKKGKIPDPTIGPRVNTKKRAVYECWKSGGNEDACYDAALKFMGKRDAAAEKSTRGSTIAWRKEFKNKYP